jgi:O-antigen chain-terminating methyltransferase
VRENLPKPWPGNEPKQEANSVPKSTEEILAQIAAIRQRVAERYPASVSDVAGTGGGSTLSLDLPAEPVPLADLMPLFEARDAADGKVAAIGKVNPRRGGLANTLIQVGKRTIARGLNWFVRDQVDFNAATVRAVSETLEALNEVNRSVAILAAEQARLRRAIAEGPALVAEARAEADARLREATDNLSGQIRVVAGTGDSLREVLGKLSTRLDGLAVASETAIDGLRQDAEAKARAREREDIRLLRALADFQNASRQQWAQLESELRRAIDARGSVAEERAQTAANSAMEQAVARMDGALHRELRLLRQRVGSILENARGTDTSAVPIAAQAVAAEHGAFDSLAFSERFRGSEADVKEKLRVYLPSFADCSPVADLGCGRGEFLDLLRETGVTGIGVEANPELAAMVRAKGHPAVCEDLIAFLAGREAESLGGIFCAHVIEHMPAEALLRMLNEAQRVLRPGGILALETPNPGCLAIFATYFFLDPTHLRPVPSELVRYLLVESGFTAVRILGLHPAEEEFPELKPLPEPFRQQFFGSLDYGVLAQKPLS